MKRKPTVMRFLGTFMVIFFAFSVLGMSAIFMYVLNYADYDDAKNDVGREARHAGRNVVLRDDGTVELGGNYDSSIEGCSTAIINADGKVISGSLPISQKPVALTDPGKQDQNPDGSADPGKQDQNPDGSADPGDSEGTGSGSRKSGRHMTPGNGRDGKFYIIEENGEKYNVYDWKVRMLRHEDGSMENVSGSLLYGEYYIRSVLSEKDHKTVYQRILLLYNIFMFLLILAAIIGGRWLYKKAARPFAKMCENMERVTTDPDYSERITTEARFYETDVMKTVYNSLMDRNEKLKKLQEEFNENVSHELRTPVAVIRSESELIRDLYADKVPEEVIESASVIYNQTERINAMISELMYMAKMDREDFALKKEAMELSDIAESVCEDMEEVVLKGHKFVYHWEPSEAELDVDLIVIAVRNIITNAVKYSPKGSTIDLYSGTEEEAADGAGSTAEESGGSGDGRRFAFLKVTDYGIGISADEQKRIFDPYYQVKAERNSEGFGLGLPLTKKIAVKHGGTVRVKSEPGKGSTFTLVLPVK